MKEMERAREPDNVIQQCIAAAKDAVGEVNAQLLCLPSSNFISDSIQEKELVEGQPSGEIEVDLSELKGGQVALSYCNAYFQEWRAAGKGPLREMRFSGCLIGSQVIKIIRDFAQKRGAPLFFNNCSIVLPHDVEIEIEAITNSQITSGSNSQNIKINAREIINCVFQKDTFLMSNCEFVRGSIFEKKLSMAASELKVRLENCYVECLDAALGSHYDACVINRAICHRGCEFKNSLLLRLFIEMREEQRVFHGDMKLFDSSIERLSIKAVDFKGAFLMNDLFIATPPTISGVSFASRNIDFSALQFGDTTSQEAVGAFRSLTYLCQEAGYEHGAIMFHGFELEALHNNEGFKQNTEWIHRFCGHVYRCTTNYGRSITHPLMILSIIMLMSALLYSWELGFWNGFLMSLKNFFGPFAFFFKDEIHAIQPTRDILEVLSFVQIAISSIMWFLVVFMVRRRFKL